ncbi:MAG: type II glyceraldehyde-3-phosphate dehydrogenase [Thermoplasmatales archaeon]
MLKVGINAYGTIGKRVADAIAKQPDMKISGVVKAHANYMSHVASKRFSLYVPDKGAAKAFDEAGIKTEGTVEDLIEESDIIVDATPEGEGEKYKKMYEKARKKALFQGGEEHSLTGTSFNAYANYEEAWGKDYVRVVSCNTTALVRTIYPLTGFGKIRVRANLVRRATDPDDYTKGPINSIVPDLKIPSHHGPDVASVIKGLDIQTMAVKVPTTLMHLHFVQVAFPENISAENILSAWSGLRRIAFVSGKDGVKSTSQIMDIARETGRERSDLYEIVLWRDSISIKGNELFYYQAVHQESDVVPENVDAIRSMFQLKDKESSIRETDSTLRIGDLIYGR